MVIIPSRSPQVRADGKTKVAQMNLCTIPTDGMLRHPELSDTVTVTQHFEFHFLFLPDKYGITKRVPRCLGLLKWQYSLNALETLWLDIKP